MKKNNTAVYEVGIYSDSIPLLIAHHRDLPKRRAEEDLLCPLLYVMNIFSTELFQHDLEYIPLHPFYVISAQLRQKEKKESEQNGYAQLYGYIIIKLPPTILLSSSYYFFFLKDLQRQLIKLLKTFHSIYQRKAIHQVKSFQDFKPEIDRFIGDLGKRVSIYSKLQSSVPKEGSFR